MLFRSSADNGAQLLAGRHDRAALGPGAALAAGDGAHVIDCDETPALRLADQRCQRAEYPPYHIGRAPFVEQAVAEGIDCRHGEPRQLHAAEIGQDVKL